LRFAERFKVKKYAFSAVSSRGEILDSALASAQARCLPSTPAERRASRCSLLRLIFRRENANRNARRISGDDGFRSTQSVNDNARCHLQSFRKFFFFLRKYKIGVGKR
jgi:hypothetical protein